jgi:hypothetical protein
VLDAANAPPLGASEQAHNLKPTNVYSLVISLSHMFDFESHFQLSSNQVQMNDTQWLLLTFAEHSGVKPGCAVL